MSKMNGELKAPLITQEEREDILSKHNHKIWQATDGKWCTYFTDETRTKNRRLGRYATLESCENAVIEYWERKENPCYETEKKRKLMRKNKTKEERTVYNKDRPYCVYKHTSPNGKSYIGVTAEEDPNDRWANGFGYKHNSYFESAIIKYGWDNFTHEILYEDLTLEEANIVEKAMIIVYKTNIYKYGRDYGYNMTDGGEGRQGYKMTEKQVRKNSELNSGDKNPFFGKHHTEETKQKMRESKVGMYDRANNPRAKKIIQYDLHMNQIKEWQCMKDISDDLGISEDGIRKCCQRKKEEYKGYVWRYKDDTA